MKHLAAALPTTVLSAAPSRGPSLRTTSQGPATPTRSGGKPAKARHRSACLADDAALEALPNIGPALAQGLRLIGIETPRDLIGRDAFVLYQELCARTGVRHDPCVLDSFMAAVDFMRGAPAAPWWHYTAQRKLLYGQAQGEALAPGGPDGTPRNGGTGRG